MSYKQLQKQFARQKLLSTIISFTSAEYAVYVIDATETICRTVDDMLPFLCSSNKMLSCLAHSTINVGQTIRVVAASQARNISASTLYIPIRSTAHSSLRNTNVRPTCVYLRLCLELTFSSSTSKTFWHSLKIFFFGRMAHAAHYRLSLVIMRYISSLYLLTYLLVRTAPSLNPQCTELRRSRSLGLLCSRRCILSLSYGILTLTFHTSF